MMLFATGRLGREAVSVYRSACTSARPLVICSHLPLSINAIRPVGARIWRGNNDTIAAEHPNLANRLGACVCVCSTCAWRRIVVVKLYVSFRRCCSLKALFAHIIPFVAVLRSRIIAKAGKSRTMHGLWFCGI